jgi:fimbrial chaperone protein
MVMLTTLRASFVSIATMVISTAASAASLQVAPTTVEVPSGSNATTMSLKNSGSAPLKAQIRVFRWTYVNGIEKLEQAKDVVASPPIATIKPNMDYTVRLVRLSKQPVQIEETYRVMIDEIVDPSQRRAGTVTMAFRYSVPVFFLPSAAPKGDLVWSLEKRNGRVFVSATNTGGRRIRVADLTASGPQGKPVTVAKGLAGYVLARSSKSWVAPQVLQTAPTPLLIKALSESGPINAQVLPAAAR